jgi:hypothetical protein
MMTRRVGLAVVVMLVARGLRADLRGAIPDPAIATPIEQALIEQACSAPPAIAIDPDRHDECLHAKLTSLRADFGRDLNKLSSGDRRRIDAACEQIRGAEGREGYLSCLASQLTALQARWNRGRGAAAETTQVAAASPDPQLVAAAAPAPGSNASPSRTWVVVLTLATLSAAALGLFFAMKARPRTPSVCRVCGTGVEGAGDLCASCRREAAETVRRAAADRADRQRAHDDQQRHQQEQEEEEQRRLAEEAEEAQQRQREMARQSAEAVLKAEEEARLRDAERSEEAERHPVPDDENAVFDPYRVLAVSQDANADVIRAAYDHARSKYDLGHVEGLGDEIKQHYSLKAQEVDRAFQMLADSHGIPAASQSHELAADHLTGVSHS